MGHHQGIRQARVSSLHQYCIRKNTSVQITLPNARGRVRSSMHLVPSSQEYTIRVFFSNLLVVSKNMVLDVEGQKKEMMFVL